VEFQRGKSAGDHVLDRGEGGQILNGIAHLMISCQSFLIKKIKAKELLKEGSKGADVNEGRFVLNIDVLFALQRL
jgi:hypothetical protein